MKKQNENEIPKNFEIKFYVSPMSKSDNLFKESISMIEDSELWNKVEDFLSVKGYKLLSKFLNKQINSNGDFCDSLIGKSIFVLFNKNMVLTNAIIKNTKYYNESQEDSIIVKNNELYLNLNKKSEL